MTDSESRQQVILESLFYSLKSQPSFLPNSNFQRLDGENFHSLSVASLLSWEKSPYHDALVFEYH